MTMQRFVLTFEMKDFFLLISVEPVLMTAVEKHVNTKSFTKFFFLGTILQVIGQPPDSLL